VPIVPAAVSPRRPVRLLILACLAAAVVAACGKKGPPLPPFAKAPAAPAEISARRMGDRVEVRFTVPTTDLDGQEPASIDRIEVWALTGPAVEPDRFREYATLVGTVPVRRPPPPPADVDEGEPPPPDPPPSTEPGLDQGQQGVIVDELTPDELVPIAIPELERERAREEEAARRRRERAGEPKLLPPDVGVPLEPPPMRHYVVVGRNGGRWGTPGQRMPVPIAGVPPAPAAPELTAAEDRITLAWTEPPGVRRPLHAGTAPPSTLPGTATPQPTGAALGTGAQEDDLPPLLPPGDEVRPFPVRPPVEEPDRPDEDAVAPSGSTEPAAGGADADPDADDPVLPSRSLSGFPSTRVGYHVYLVAPPGLTPAGLQPGEVPLLPRRLTDGPLRAVTFDDTGFEVGVERCYAVRTVETTGSVSVESAPSPPACITPRDTYPPAAPASLAAVASEGAISLIWDASRDPDLAGYLVLRGTVPDGALQPLMERPIQETTWRDTTVTPGVRYVYVVVAVDGAEPPNRSAPSNRVEEVAR
jgi:predicted small lipoprotein YifL